MEKKLDSIKKKMGRAVSLVIRRAYARGDFKVNRDVTGDFSNEATISQPPSEADLKE